MSKNNNMAVAEKYYAALARKDLTEMAQYLHPDVEFISPLATLQGKQAYLKAAKGFAEAIVTITVRGIFGDDNQVMMAYDTLFPEPIGHFATASLITFEDGLMRKLEFFYDSRPLVNKHKDQIFEK
jgi:ketosteroid isomerase-like protein